MSATTGPGQPELRQAAIGSLITFVGAAASAALGFAFSLLLARGLGADGAGVVLQAIGCFTIALGLARLGLDTTAVWLLPRLRSQEPDLVRPALTGLLAPAALGSTALLAVWLLTYWALRAAGVGDDRVLAAITLAGVFLPCAAVMMVALAATRAFGGVVPFNLIGNITVPGLRPALLVGVLAASGGPLMASLAWGSVWLVGAVLALVVLARQSRRAQAPAPPRSRRPDRALRRRIRTFALPRVVSSALEQSILWLDVVLVGVLLGSAAAGVYGTVSRFVMAGALVGTALRIVVAPRFSALLGEERLDEVEVALLLHGEVDPAARGSCLHPAGAVRADRPRLARRGVRGRCRRDGAALRRLPDRAGGRQRAGAAAHERAERADGPQQGRRPGGQRAGQPGADPPGRHQRRGRGLGGQHGPRHRARGVAGAAPRGRVRRRAHRGSHRGRGVPGRGRPGGRGRLVVGPGHAAAAARDGSLGTRPGRLLLRAPGAPGLDVLRPRRGPGRPAPAAGRPVRVPTCPP